MYINKIMKFSISLAYKDDSSQGYEKQNQSQKTHHDVEILLFT